MCIVAMFTNVVTLTGMMIQMISLVHLMVVFGDAMIIDSDLTRNNLFLWIFLQILDSTGGDKFVGKKCLETSATTSLIDSSFIVTFYNSTNGHFWGHRINDK